MASKTRSPKPSEDTNSHNKSAPEAIETAHKVLMPREYYEERHPWFGSQIHYTIDVFRQLIRDARARKQSSSKDGG